MLYSSLYEARARFASIYLGRHRQRTYVHIYYQLALIERKEVSRVSYNSLSLDAGIRTYLLEQYLSKDPIVLLFTYLGTKVTTGEHAC